MIGNFSNIDAGKKGVKLTAGPEGSLFVCYQIL